MLKDRQPDIERITIVLMLDDPTIYGRALPITFIHPDGSQASENLAPLRTMGDQPSLTVSPGFTLARDPQEIAVKVDEASLSAIPPALVEERDGQKRLNPTQIKDVLLMLIYTILATERR
jgi:hypothetical protein